MESCIKWRSAFSEFGTIWQLTSSSSRLFCLFACLFFKVFFSICYSALLGIYYPKSWRESNPPPYSSSSTHLLAFFLLKLSLLKCEVRWDKNEFIQIQDRCGWRMILISSALNVLSVAYGWMEKKGKMLTNKSELLNFINCFERTNS